MPHFKVEAKRITVTMRNLGVPDPLILAAVGCSLPTLDRWQANYAAFGHFAGVAEP